MVVCNNDLFIERKLCTLEKEKEQLKNRVGYLKSIEADEETIERELDLIEIVHLDIIFLQMQRRINKKRINGELYDFAIR